MDEHTPDQRITKLEEQIVDQEHRLFPVLKNFFIDRRSWPPSDPRRAASARALIWALFFSPGTVVFAGGVTALATLGVLVWQNTLIREQNTYFRDQISQQQIQIEAQNELNLQMRRDQSITKIYDAATHPRVKSESIRTLLALNQKTLLHDAPLDGIVVENVEMDYVSFVGSSMKGSSLMSSRMKYGFFRGSDLTGANLAHSDLTGTLWSGANLTDADLTKANIEDANMLGVSLVRADLNGVNNWQSAYFKDANIYGIKDPPEGFRDYALSQGAVETPP